MKKILFGALLPAMMLSACSSSDNENEQTDGKGSIIINTEVVTDGIEVVETRAAADDLYLTLKNGYSDVPTIDKKKLTGYPDGLISDIPVGTYSIQLDTHPDGFTPAFNAPQYAGTTSNIQVGDGSTATASVTCTQKNAGVRFIYDASIQIAGLGNMYPVITQGETALEYRGNQKEATGYFEAGSISISFTDANGTIYEINGKTESTVTLSSEQLWEITLATEVESSSSISMSVVIREVNEPNKTLDLSVAQSEEMCIFNTSYTMEGSQRFLLRTFVVMSEMMYYYTKQSEWSSTQEMTKAQIQSNGVTLSSTDRTNAKSAAGLVTQFTNIDNGIKYYFWIYTKYNNKELIVRKEFTGSIQ